MAGITCGFLAKLEFFYIATYVVEEKDLPKTSSVYVMHGKKYINEIPYHDEFNSIIIVN